MAKNFAGVTPTPEPEHADDLLPLAMAGGGAAAVPELPEQDALPFLLVYSGEWEYTDDGLLPQLYSQPLIPGICGVRLLRDGTYDVAGLVSDAAAAGKIVIDNALHGYCGRIPGPGPARYRPRWARVAAGRLVHDRAAYVRTVRGWVDDGTIPAATEAQIDRARERYQGLIAADPRRGGHEHTTERLAARLAAVPA